MVNQADLAAGHITLDPRRPTPDEAMLRGSWVKVWAIIAHLRSVDGDVQLAAHDYDVPVEAVEAAHPWYAQHTILIEVAVDGVNVARPQCCPRSRYYPAQRAADDIARLIASGSVVKNDPLGLDATGLAAPSPPIRCPLGFPVANDAPSKPPHQL